MAIWIFNNFCLLFFLKIVYLTENFDLSAVAWYDRSTIMITQVKKKYFCLSTMIDEF